MTLEALSKEAKVDKDWTHISILRNAPGNFSYWFNNNFPEDAERIKKSIITALKYFGILELFEYILNIVQEPYYELKD